MYKHQWLEYMEGHERWWDSIWRAAAKRGDQEVRIVGIVMIVIVLVSSSWLWGFSWFVMIVMVVIVIVSSWCHQYDHDVSIIMIVMVMVSFWWLSWICWTFWSLAQIHRLQYFENHCSALLQVTMTPEHGPPNYQVNSNDDMLLVVMVMVRLIHIVGLSRKQFWTRIISQIAYVKIFATFATNAVNWVWKKQHTKKHIYLDN